MEQTIHKTFRQVMALILCVAMLLPLVPVEVLAESGSASTDVRAATGAPAIPSYVTAGTVSQTLEYDCGNGISNNSATSTINIVTNTSAMEFSNYQTKLTKAGYVGKTWTQDSNQFGSYVSRDGSLSFHRDTLSGNQIDIKDIGGTYRSNVYKDATAQQTDFNDTSTVIRVRFENGVSGIFYGDLNLAENIVLDIHSDDALKTDIMLVPHHLFDNHDALVSVAKARAYLISQRKSVIYGTDNNYTTQDTDNSSRNDLRKNFKSMKDTLTDMGKTEGVNYDIFWGGSETVTIDINVLGALLGKSAASRAAVNGSYYTTEKANSFTYTGWGMATPAAGQYQSAVNSAEDYLSAEKADAVSVSNSQAVFTRHGDTYFVQEGRYLLMSDKYGHIMSFDATASPEIAPGEQHGTSITGSIKLDADGGSENTYYFDENGNVIHNGYCYHNPTDSNNMFNS